jgi:hypothetical protein
VAVFFWQGRWLAVALLAGFDRLAHRAVRYFTFSYVFFSSLLRYCFFFRV